MRNVKCVNSSANQANHVRWVSTPLNHWLMGGAYGLCAGRRRNVFFRRNDTHSLKKCSTGECFQANDSQGRFFTRSTRWLSQIKTTCWRWAFPLTRAALGYPAERAALGGKYYPSANSRTNHRRGMSEAVIESSQHGDSYELLKFS